MSTTTPTPPLAPMADRPPVERVRRRINWVALAGKLTPLIGLALVFALFSALRPRTFPTLLNVRSMLIETAVVGTAALGMTIIVISGGIDISMGSTIALVTMAVALLLNRGLPPLLAAAGGVAVAALCGLAIGLMVTGLRLVPFIVTLSMWGAVRGIAELLGRESVVNAPDTWLNGLLSGPGIPPGVWLMLALGVLVSLALRYTRFGRRVFAIGSNEQTARLCGVPVARTKVLTYVVGGAFAGVAGVLLFSKMTQGDPTSAGGMELDIIAAAVIGGASLSGGQGSVLGSLVGALIMTVVSNGCSSVGMPNSRQKIVTGGIIILAATLDRWRQDREAA